MFYMMDPAQQWHILNSLKEPELNTKPPKLHYLVVEMSDKKSCVFDSRLGKSVNMTSEGKRQMLITYLEENEITNVVCIYEVGLPSGRSQIVCWYR